MNHYYVEINFYGMDTIEIKGDIYSKEVIRAVRAACLKNPSDVDLDTFTSWVHGAIDSFFDFEDMIIFVRSEPKEQPSANSANGLRQKMK